MIKSYTKGLRQLTKTCYTLGFISGRSTTALHLIKRKTNELESTMAASSTILISNSWGVFCRLNDKVKTFR